MAYAVDGRGIRIQCLSGCGFRVNLPYEARSKKRLVAGKWSAASWAGFVRGAESGKDRKTITAFSARAGRGYAAFQVSRPSE
jgi:hypothetical protein